MTRARAFRSARPDPQEIVRAALARFEQGFPPDDAVLDVDDPHVVAKVVAWGRERVSASARWHHDVAVGRVGPVLRPEERRRHQEQARVRLDQDLAVLGVFDDIEARLLDHQPGSFNDLADGLADDWRWS